MKRASLRDLPAEIWRPDATGRQEVPRLLEAHANRTCLTCGVSLQGRRRQARYCSGACRALASRDRRLAA